MYSTSKAQNGVNSEHLPHSHLV